MGGHTCSVSSRHFFSRRTGLEDGTLPSERLAHTCELRSFIATITPQRLHFIFRCAHRSSCDSGTTLRHHLHRCSVAAAGGCCGLSTGSGGDFSSRDDERLRERCVDTRRFGGLVTRSTSTGRSNATSALRGAGAENREEAMCTNDDGVCDCCCGSDFCVSVDPTTSDDCGDSFGSSVCEGFENRDEGGGALRKKNRGTVGVGCVAVTAPCWCRWCSSGDPGASCRDREAGFRASTGRGSCCSEGSDSGFVRIIDGLTDDVTIGGGAPIVIPLAVDAPLWDMGAVSGGGGAVNRSGG